MIKLNKTEIKYIDDNLKEKTIFKIARELSEKRTDIVRRRDIIEYYREKLDRDIVKEKFGDAKPHLNK